MMQQTYDFFALTGLSFDPPVRSQNLVLKAITEAVSNLSNRLSHETQQVQRDALRTEIDFLIQQSALINTTGWTEASRHFDELAELRKTRERERVQFAASLLVQNGVNSLNKGVIRSFRQKTGLSAETLTEVLLHSGIELSSDTFSEKIPKFPPNGERIQCELKELRTIKNPNPNAPDSSAVTDLYSFVAYLMDDLDHADYYRKLSTRELKTIVDLTARKYNERSDRLGKLCCSLSSAAGLFVFNSEDNRKAYDAMALYHHVALQSLFDALKMIPGGILLQPDFADRCVNLIRVFFPDYETALAIYNKESNLTEIPYLPSANDENTVQVHLGEQDDSLKRSTSRVYGISYGSSFSAIATLDDNGIPAVIPNPIDDSDLLASAVFFPTGAAPIVGELARNERYDEPERVVECIKQYLGRPGAQKFNFDGIEYDPTTVTAIIFKRIVQYANEQGYDVKDVVLTCPTYFGVPEMSALKQAAMIAGLHVLEIIHEPTAAVLSSFSAGDLLKPKKILVYDLGGKTFDLTLFESKIDDGTLQLNIITTDGNDFLGGSDWDERMFDYMCEEYASETGLEVSAEDPDFRLSVGLQAEQAKKALSVRERRNCLIMYDGDRTKIALTCEKFEARTQDLVQWTIDSVEQLLAKVHYTPDDVDEVLLVGGSTYMPMIKGAVEGLFPGKVRREQPDLAVAKGAALYPSLLRDKKYLPLSEPEIGCVICVDPIPERPVAGRSIGVGIFDTEGHKINNVLFVDDVLPAEDRRKYYTGADNLEEINLTLYSDASRDELIDSCDDVNGNLQATDPRLDIRRIGVFKIMIPPGTPKGAEVDVLFRNTGDMLELKATVEKNGFETTAIFDIKNEV